MAISSSTLSMIREIVSLLMEAPYTSWTCADISPMAGSLGD